MVDLSGGVIRALMMPINLRKPPVGLIHYSDRGSQYASHAYQLLLKQYGMICSMNRKGIVGIIPRLNVSSRA